MPGPAPNPDARRRNDKNAWRVLPASCETPAPAWPIDSEPHGLPGLWAYLWALPQAELWHEQDAVRLIARYATLILLGEGRAAGTVGDDGELSVDSLLKLSAEIRQVEDRLLISPSTLIRARCVIAEPAPAELLSEVASLDDARRARAAS